MNTENKGNTQNTLSNQGIEEELEEFLENENPLHKDLLSQIAAEDLKNEEKNKQKVRPTISFSKLFTVTLMRITLFIDTADHKYAHILKGLKLIWSFLVGLIYLGGFFSLLVLGYAYQNYPSNIERFFESHHIDLSSWNLDQYTLSRIVLTNLKDNKGSYSIDKMTIRSDFSDFLNKRIKSVTLDGVNIMIQETDENFEIGYLAELLIKLNQAVQNEHQIGSVSVTNATAVIKGATYELPIHFSMTGFYEHSTSISIPLTIKQPYMNISGMLSISGSGDNLEWILDILSGNLSFPNQQPENISGQFKFNTTNHLLSTIKGSLSLVYGKNKKDIKIDLKNSKGTFVGTTDLSFINQEVQNKTDETQTNLNLIFDGLTFKNFSLVESNKPIRFSLKSFSMKDFVLSNATGILNGQLTCKDFVCSYQINKDAAVNIQSLKTTYQGNTYSTKERMGFTIVNNKRPNLILNGKIATLDLTATKFTFNGFRNTSSSDFRLSAKKINISGKLGNKTTSDPMLVNVNDASYESADIKLENANVSIPDIWQENPDFQLNAKEVYFKNNHLLKVPLTASANRRSGILQANLSILNNSIQSKFKGTANLLNGTFQGTFVVKPFQLKKDTPALNTLSTLFPPELQNVTGKAALYGKINWKNEKQVSGPFYLSLSDINFDLGNTNIQKLNTVLLVQTLAPFTSAANQEIFISELNNNIVPLQNIHSVIKFDNQMARLTSLNIQSGGAALSLENALLPYRSTNIMFYLKNQDLDLSLINPYLEIPGLQITGTASLSLPFEFRQNMLNLNNSEIKLNNVLLKYTGTDEKIKNALFSETPEYMVKSGSILLSQVNPTTTDAYVNFDGRTTSSQTKSTYKETIPLNLKSMIKPMPAESVPESIRQKQEQINHATED